jgi:Replication-relaxation
MPDSHALRHPLPGDPPGALSAPVAPAAAAVAAPVPGRSPDGRPVAAALAALSRLTERDLLLADWLDQHGVLTTAQISAALFGHRNTANHRLLRLREIGLIDRFRRPLPGGGTTAWHWVLGPLGAQLVAAARGQAPPTRRQLTDRQLQLASSPQLAHRLGINSFFIRLYAHARGHPHTALLRWWSERDTARRYTDRIHPDGHGLWQHGATITGFFLEHDTGTENLNRLIRKLDAYDELAADGGPAYPVLFWLHSSRREDNLHTALATRRRPGYAECATAARIAGTHPATAVWRLAGHPGRHPLHQLPCWHGRPDSLYAANLHDPDLDHLFAA